MTQKTDSGPRSMRYTLDEVLSGMLASIELDMFTDDSQRLGEAFKALSQSLPRSPPWSVKPTFQLFWNTPCKPWSAMDTWSTSRDSTICLRPVAPGASQASGRCSMPVISGIWRRERATLKPIAAR
jgi:hypothetical protein